MGDVALAGALIAGDFLLGGPTGEGIAPVMAILGVKSAVKQGAKIGLSRKGIKPMKKHLNEFKELNPKFNLRDQIRLGRKIAENEKNLVEKLNSGAKIYQQNVTIGSKTIPVRVGINASGNLRPYITIRSD